MKKIIIVILTIGTIWGINGYYILKLSKKELEVKKIRQKLENYEKEAEKKEMEYDTIIDLEKIEKEMKKKNNMSISKEIKFFQIQE